MKQTEVQVPLALTMGDPAGVGPELTVKAWQQLRAHAPKGFVLYGDPALFEDKCPTAEIFDPREASAVFADALPIIPVPCATQPLAGVGDSTNGAATLTSIDRAVDSVMTGQCSAVVTNPINKAVLYDAGFRHPGHTEYLQALAHEAEPTVMLLTDGTFRVVPITLHISLKQAVETLNGATILHAIRTTARYLADICGIAAPRMAVSGLNPHAGEGGAMGREEIEIITPALEVLRAEGHDVVGPLPADSMFNARARQTYDVALCMTHDQALIPIKTLAFDEGVNCTMGLPFIRTSPDHGTAYDIAGKGIARPDSLLAALRLAEQFTQSASEARAKRHDQSRH